MRKLHERASFTSKCVCVCADLSQGEPSGRRRRRVQYTYSVVKGFGLSLFHSIFAHKGVKPTPLYSRITRGGDIQMFRVPCAPDSSTLSHPPLHRAPITTDWSESNCLGMRAPPISIYAGYTFILRSLSLSGVWLSG